MDFHHHIVAIDSSKINWTLKVRVTRMWPSIDDEGAVVRQNLILLDCRLSHIHAIVKPAIWNQINHDVFEGGLYIIRNFRVLQPQGSLRPVTQTKCISFLQATVVNQIPGDDFAIHLHKFELVPLTSLFIRIDPIDPEAKPTYAADVIGVLQALEPIQMTQTNNVTKQVIRFSISDGSISHPVRFYGPPNENTAALYGHDLHTPIIIILACVRISQHRGKFRITSLPGSKVYVNLQYPDVFDLRQRLVEIENQSP